MVSYYKSCFCLLFSILFLSAEIYSQTAPSGDTDKVCRNDSVHFRFKDQAVPVALIAGGLIIEAANVKKDIQSFFPRTNTRADDYLRYVPVGLLYGSDIIRTRHRNNVFNQTKLLLISELTTAILTQTIKKLTNITRPNGGNLSFPSGHTSEAFTFATVLYKETIDYDPVLAYSGYLFSSATGVLRITNNRHWASDVLVGAGLGIIVTNLVYYINPFRNWDPLKLNDKTQITPCIDPGSGTCGVSVNVVF